MTATPEQIARVREVYASQNSWPSDRDALAAVLDELRKLRDACLLSVKRDGSTPLVIKDALAACQK